MEQPPEEAPEVREEEEKEEVAETQGAPELNGGPEHSLPSSSYTGEEEAGRDTGGGVELWPLQTACGSAESSVDGLEPGAWLTPLLRCSPAAGPGQVAQLFLRQESRGHRHGLL